MCIGGDVGGGVGDMSNVGALGEVDAHLFRCICSRVIITGYYPFPFLLWKVRCMIGLDNPGSRQRSTWISTMHTIGFRAALGLFQGRKPAY